jgi:hypothetical protein
MLKFAHVGAIRRGGAMAGNLVMCCVLGCEVAPADAAFEVDKPTSTQPDRSD